MPATRCTTRSSRLPSEEIQRLFQVNLVGAALVTREFLPDMIRAGGGDVVMIASIAGRIPMTPCGVYSASKHGLVALAELLRVEVARFNVRVHVVCPGRVETDFFSHESFRQRALIGPRPPARSRWRPSRGRSSTPSSVIGS